MNSFADGFKRHLHGTWCRQIDGGCQGVPAKAGVDRFTTLIA